MDIRMPVHGRAGRDAADPGAAATRRRSPSSRPSTLDEYVYAALAAGAAGFLLKDTPPREIAAAVRAVADGTATLSPAVTSDADRRPTSTGAPPRAGPQALRRLAELSDREREVLAAARAAGSPTPTLARQLFVSEATVKTYVSRLLAKLDLANRTQAAILAHEAGLLEG